MAKKIKLKDSGKKSNASAKPNPFSSSIQRGKRNPLVPDSSAKKSSRPVPGFGKKAGPLSTPMGRQKSGSLSPIREEFPTTDTSWMAQGMTVRVKWISESASLGGPTPVEFEGEVKYVDGVWLNMIGRAHPHAHAHVMREWIFEAKEVEQ